MLQAQQHAIHTAAQKKTGYGDEACTTLLLLGSGVHLQLCGGQDEGDEGEENDERDRENDGGDVVTPGTHTRHALALGCQLQRPAR